MAEHALHGHFTVYVTRGGLLYHCNDRNVAPQLMDQDQVERGGYMYFFHRN